MADVSTVSKLRMASRIVCALGFVAAGLNHFFNPGVYCKIMPDYLPYPLELVYVSGVFELLGGLGLLVPQTRKAAVWGLILLLIAVFPANINMAVHPDLTPKLPYYLLLLRLPIQGLLIFWVWRCRN